MLTGVSESRVAARIGKAAFFAPEIRISPERLAPPVIISLSIVVTLDCLCKRQGFKIMIPYSLCCEMAGFIKATELGKIE